MSQTYQSIFFFVYANLSNPILDWVSFESFNLIRSNDDFDFLDNPIFLHFPNNGRLEDGLGNAGSEKIQVNSYLVEQGELCDVC